MASNGLRRWPAEVGDDGHACVGRLIANVKAVFPEEGAADAKRLDVRPIELQSKWNHMASKPTERSTTTSITSC